jgi:hypothetical protein
MHIGFPGVYIWLIWLTVSFLALQIGVDLENQRNALILVFQIMQMHANKQLAHYKPGISCAQTTYSSTINSTNTECQEMLKELISDDTPAKEQIAAWLLTKYATTAIHQCINVRFMTS